MKDSRLLILLCMIVLLSSCGSSITDDKSIGDVENETFRSLVEQLTNQLKNRFSGNSYQAEKITPSEDAQNISIGLPDQMSYTFVKSNDKFIKGDINKDGKWDLIIACTFKQEHAADATYYFVYLQQNNIYKAVGMIAGTEFVDDYRRERKLLDGYFVLDSISNGLLIGNSHFRSGKESYYRDYSYKIDTEAYKYNPGTNRFDLQTQSPLLMKNAVSGKFEPVAIQVAIAKK